MNRPFATLASVAPVAILLACASTTQAAVLAAALPSSPDGESTDAWSSAGTYLAGQTIAATFILDRSARIESVSVWGASTNLSFPSLDNVAGVEVVIWNADFSQALATVSLGVGEVAAAPTGETTSNGGIQFQITADVTGIVTAPLPAGTYHLNVGALLVDAGADPFQWSSSQGGSLWMNSFDDDGWVDGGSAPTPAFQIDGEILAADLDGNGTVDGADLGELLGSWGPCTECGGCLADLDGDCVVDGADLGILLGEWL